MRYIITAVWNLKPYEKIIKENFKIINKKNNCIEVKNITMTHIHMLSKALESVNINDSRRKFVNKASFIIEVEKSITTLVIYDGYVEI